MEKQTKDFVGKNGFIWFVGVVEDRKDPLKLGRCKVRCVGWHSPDKTQLPTNALPVTLSVPATLTPVLVKITVLAVPPMPTVMFPFDVGVLILLVPFAILFAISALPTDN